MTPQELLLEVFCLVGDGLQAPGGGPLRRRGPAPKLADSEVIPIELVGELWKLATDRDLFRFFRRYHRAEFPALARVHRTTFARQAANLWRLKQRPQRRLAGRLAGRDTVWLVDSMPVEACRSARATFCRRFAGEADYGYDHLAKRTVYGSRLRLRCTRDGVILAYQLAPARASAKAVLPELGLPAGTTGTGDRGDWDPALRDRLAARGVALPAPSYRKSRDPDPARSARLSAVRYRSETVQGRLADRVGVRRVWAKDRRHLCHRLIRKILSHTAAQLVNLRAARSPLRLDALAAG